MTTRGVTILRGGVHAVADAAAAAERAGFHSAWSPEFYTRSAVVTLAAIAQRTTDVRIGSSIAYAIGRTPLMLATEARSLDELCGGRLVLGLGTGTKGMMEHWHGVDPASPAVRIEELVPLLRSLWRLHEGPVKHDGRFYHVDLVPTAEAEAPERTDIPVFTAGVNPRMVESAGRVADGFFGHPLFTVKYVEEVVRPAIARGAEKTGRDAAAVEVCGVVIVAVDDDEAVARRAAAAQLAFYASPKTYAGVLDVGGFAAVGDTIRTAFKARDFEAMVAAVPDAMIDACAVAGTPEQVRAGLARYDGVLDHLIVYPPSFLQTPEACDALATALIDHAAPVEATA